MALNYPGIAVAEQVTTSPASQTDSLPLFIGFTAKGPVHQPRQVNSLTDFVQQFGAGFAAQPQLSYLYRTVKSFFDCGGTICQILSLGPRNDLKGGELYWAIKAISDVDGAAVGTGTAVLVACPEISSRPEEFAAGTTQYFSDYWDIILPWCAKLSNAFAILDLPYDLQLAETALNRTPDSGTYGAAYWPPLIDRSAGAGPETAWLTPPCGAVAALYQRVDRERGVWHAPANVALSSPWWPAIDTGVSDGVLFCSGPDQLSANIIRPRRGRGARIWGARTLAPASMSGMRYVQQRRLLSQIEAYLRDAGQFALFESNNELTWLKLQSIASTFLHNLWRGGALAGASEAEAYRVAIGLGQTMTDADIDAGRMTLGIDVATLVPAEFISISIDYLRS